MPRHPLLPTPFDDLKTETSSSQISTELDIVNYLLPWAPSDQADGPPASRPIESAILYRNAHLDYLRPMFSNLSTRWTALDASRSWIMYWILGAFSLLGYEPEPDDRLRAIETILSFQDPNGGFGGGAGHMPHLAASYACISALSMLLHHADQDLIEHTWAQVDRKALYRWMMSLKLPDGSFAVQTGGEVDVRGCYGALVVATLLNILTPDLVEGLPEYFANCQTHEGGMAATATPDFPGQAKAKLCPTASPIGEAHGGYATCALASHFLIRGMPSLSGAPRPDYEAFLRWAAHMQALPIEGGGFRGRTNKLVDGCYSWWCGGLFPLLEALITAGSPEPLDLPDLFDRQALQEYVLLISQDQPPEEINGGLRDKPTMPPDMYHTHYVLAGLSIAQHSQKHSPSRIQALRDKFKAPPCSQCFLGAKEEESEAVRRMKETYALTLGWEVQPEKKLIIGVPENEIMPVHPVLNIPQSAAKRVMDHFYHQTHQPNLFACSVSH